MKVAVVDPRSVASLLAMTRTLVKENGSDQPALVTVLFVP